MNLFFSSFLAPVYIYTRTPHPPITLSSLLLSGAATSPFKICDYTWLDIERSGLIGEARLHEGRFAERTIGPTKWQVGCLLGPWVPAGRNMESSCRSGEDCCSGLQNVTVESFLLKSDASRLLLKSVLFSSTAWQRMCNNRQACVSGWRRLLEYPPFLLNDFLQLPPQLAHIFTHMYRRCSS